MKQSPFLLRILQLLKPNGPKIGALVVFTIFLVLLKHYKTPKNLVGNLDFVGVLERNLYDIRFKLRGPRPVSQSLGILAVDEHSVAKFGRWPFNRSVYEKSLENLKKAGVELVGFDAIFSEPERPFLDESIETIQEGLGAHLDPQNRLNIDGFSSIMETLLQTSKGDLSFARGLKSFANIVTGYFYFESKESQEGLAYDWKKNASRLEPSVIDFVTFPKGKKLEDFPEILTYGVVSNTDPLAQQFPAGFFNNSADSDGIVRSATLLRGVVPVHPETKAHEPAFLVPSLALQMAAQYLKRTLFVEFDEYGVSAIKLMDPAGKANPIYIPIIADGSARMLIQHYGRELTFPHVSLVDAYENNLKGKVPKILLFGAVGTGLADIRPSPFSESFNGVEHHASILENILTNHYMKRSEKNYIFELIMLLGVGVALVYVVSTQTPGISLYAVMVLCVVFFVFDKILMFGRGHWFYAGMMYAEIFGIFVSITIFRYFTEEKEKKKIKNAFQHYLNPSVISELMQDPENLKLGGQKRELTVFFSDVRGFTTISETLSPEALTDLLNEYFTPMTNIIMQSSGCLDKYMGDAIMAFWGAPVHLADHADKAVISSLKMLDALDILRQKWKERNLPMIDIGIGINTGMMCVGNMGGDQRFDYTVLGDAVNLGSRLEGINKQYGTRIIISEFTKAKLVNPALFDIRELDDIQVKGKTEPVKIFEILRVAPKYKSKAAELIGLFEEGLKWYRSQAWDEAMAKFSQALRLAPNDGPSVEFMDRCEYLMEHPPEPNWNGVWIMKTK